MREADIVTIARRIQMCRLVEKVESNKELSAKLELINASKFHGKIIYKQINHKRGEMK